MQKKIKQVIVEDRNVYLFTDNPKEDIAEFQRSYEKEEYLDGMPLGYEIPLLTTYRFLGKEHECISLWFDNEDVPDFYIDFTN